jgi:hypothetical protein
MEQGMGGNAHTFQCVKGLLSLLKQSLDIHGSLYAFMAFFIANSMYVSGC